MIDTLQQLDARALLWFNSGHTPLMDTLMMAATNRFTWIPLYLLLLWLLWRRFGWRRTLVWLLAIALTITLADQLCASVLRPVFQRLRPANLDNPLSHFVTVVDGYRGGRYGFPSCHGSNCAALAVIVSLIYKRRAMTLGLTLWALLNCYTRMYLGVHYPGDILVGALIGALIAWGIYLLTARVVMPRLTPTQSSSNRPQRSRG